MLHTHHDRQATLTGGTANGFLREPLVGFSRVCISVLMLFNFGSVDDQKVIWQRIRSKKTMANTIGDEI